MFLAKKPDAEKPLKKLFTDNQGNLNAALRLERSPRRTDINESDFVQFYPYPTGYIDLCIGIMSGIRLQPGAPRYYGGSNRTIIKQAYEMLVSERTAFAKKREPWSSRLPDPYFDRSNKVYALPGPSEESRFRPSEGPTSYIRQKPSRTKGSPPKQMTNRKNNPRCRKSTSI